MKNIIFIAPPAAGKGTHSKLITEKYGIPHISTGELLRSASKANNECAELITSFIDKGMFVPDDLVLKMIKERLAQEDCNNGYILDGFPRNIDQAEAYKHILDELGMSLGNVILLELDKDLAKKRINGRLTCPSCRSIYNSEEPDTKPNEDGKCDKCHMLLKRRNDDNEDTYDIRYDTYMKETAPLIEYYEEIDVLFRVDASIGKKQTFMEIEKIIGD